MALQTSGAISLNDIHVEVGGTSNTLCSLNDADFRSLINVGNNANQSLQLYYGKSNEIQMTSGGTVNGIAQRKQISASSFISSGGTLRIPSSMWVWSDDRTVAALTVDIPCTIINDGKIIGKGGQGGSGLRVKNLPHPTVSAYNSGYNTTNLGTGSDGGPAINVTSSGVTIINSSGAYICGGGGGGGSSGVEPQNSCSGGGGGAGGAEGGYRVGPNSFNDNQGSGWPNYTTNGPQYSDFGIYGTGNGNGPGLGYGGELNQRGWRVQVSNSPSWGVWSKVYDQGYGGGSGIFSGGEDQTSPSGRGGGRIVPGSRHTHSSGQPYGGAGGEAGANGGAGGNSGQSGGGGGWGAAGGKGYRGAFTNVQCQGGNAGAAITGTSRTLSNSGTIYGGT